MGGGVSDAPMLFYSKNKNYLSNQMHSFFPRTKITWGASPTTSLTSTLHQLHPTPTHGEKVGP